MVSAPTRNSDLSTTTLILYTVFLPFNKEGPVYGIRCGLGRGCATACSKYIYQSEGKGCSNSVTFLLPGFRGLPGYPQPGRKISGKGTYGACVGLLNGLHMRFRFSPNTNRRRVSQSWNPRPFKNIARRTGRAFACVLRTYASKRSEEQRRWAKFCNGLGRGLEWGEYI